MSNKSSEYLKEYNKEVRRLKQAIRRAEKRGYIVPESIIPQSPKRITQGSIRRLKKITPEKIRQKSELYVLEANPSKSKERKQSINKKSAKALQVKKDKEQRKKIDKKAKESLKKIQVNEEYRREFSMGEILYRKILDLCDKYSIDNPKGVQLIKGIIQDEINTYGKDTVMRAFAFIVDEEILATVEYCLHYPPNSPQSNNALYEITMLIEGSINPETRAKMDKAIEEDENWEDISDSEWSDLGAKF